MARQGIWDHKLGNLLGRYIHLWTPEDLCRAMRVVEGSRGPVKMGGILYLSYRSASWYGTRENPVDIAALLTGGPHWVVYSFWEAVIKADSIGSWIRSRVIALFAFIVQLCFARSLSTRPSTQWHSDLIPTVYDQAYGVEES